MRAKKTLGLMLILVSCAAVSSAFVGCQDGTPKENGEDGNETSAKGGSKGTGGKQSSGASGENGGGGGASGNGSAVSSAGGGGKSAGSAGAAGGGEPGGSSGEAGAGKAGGSGETKGAGGGAGKSTATPDGGSGTGGKADVGTADAGGGSGGSTTSKDGGGGQPSADGSTGTGGGSEGCLDVPDFSGWASGKGPADVGKLAANEMKSHVNEDYSGAGYALAFSWYGALKFTTTTGDTATNSSLASSFDTWNSAGKAPANTSDVDKRAFGVLPLELFLETKDDKYKTLGLKYADAQWDNNAGSDGITKDARYWIDDMYMITGLQVMAYRATKDSKYLDRAAKTLLSYVSALQQSDGFFWHTKQSKAYWGRANGWVAGGMTELLKELPTGSTRDSVKAAYVKQMDGLLKAQISGGGDDGCWRQVLDLSSASAETSCTAMFTYALAAGARNGWLTDSKYAAAAKKGWACLAANTDSAGKMDKVCPGTGQADAGDLASQQKFYTDRPLGKGDLHGQAPLMWAADEIITKDCHGIR